MTVTAGKAIDQHTKGRRWVPQISVAEGMTLLLSAFLLWFVLRDPRGAAEAAREGLDVALRSTLPSLFPFFVLSGLLTRSGAAERIGRTVARPLSHLFGISDAGAVAVLIGAFCGFPVGAGAVAELYRAGRIGKAECERLLALSNAPSFAFLYSAVGAGLFGSKIAGLCLYLTVTLSTFAVGAALRLLRGPCPQEDRTVTLTAPQKHAAGLLAGALTSAAQSALTVTASIVFFRVLSASLSALLAALGAGSTVTLLFTGLLELTSGMQKTAETAYGRLCGWVFCGLFAGFGGLCACLQVIATAENPLPDRADRNTSLSFRSYIVCKVVQGLLSALLSGLWGSLLPV